MPLPAMLRAARHHVPQSLHTMTPPSTNFAGTGERIGRVLWRVRSNVARAAAGRVRPQVEPFRRPTSIPLDPGPSSAALVDTDFIPKSFANEGPDHRPPGKELLEAQTLTRPRFFRETLPACQPRLFAWNGEGRKPCQRCSRGGTVARSSLYRAA